MVIPPFARAAAPLHAGVFYYVEIAKQDGNVWTHKHTLGGSANPSLLITTDGQTQSEYSIILQLTFPSMWILRSELMKYESEDFYGKRKVKT